MDWIYGRLLPAIVIILILGFAITNISKCDLEKVHWFWDKSPVKNGQIVQGFRDTSEEWGCGK
jgi:hypothetical protein